MRSELHMELRGIFGPRSLAERVLRVVGISPQHAHRFGLTIGRRHCLTMEKLIESRFRDDEGETPSRNSANDA
jgi:hypothetical protein